MVVYEKEEGVKRYSEVVHPGHPPVIDTALLADKTRKLESGTILKLSASGDTVEPAKTDDTPVAVLVENSDGKNAEVLVLWHGMVVQGRLLNSSGAKPEAASAELSANLRIAGIHPVQAWTESKKG